MQYQKNTQKHFNEKLYINTRLNEWSEYTIGLVG